VNAVNTAADASSPANALWASAPNFSDPKNAAGTSFPTTAMNAGAVSYAGGNAAHDNMMPSLAVTFIIACQGIYPFQA
jgi:microcystin-dependent protein